jgi:hypothetical protein
MQSEHVIYLHFAFWTKYLDESLQIHCYITLHSHCLILVNYLCKFGLIPLNNSRTLPSSNSKHFTSWTFSHPMHLEHNRKALLYPKVSLLKYYSLTFPTKRLNLRFKPQNLVNKSLLHPWHFK